MMVQKALLFGDEDVARKVLATSHTGNKEMQKVKSLGRRVKEFDEDKWVANRERIVFEGTLHKFRKNPQLRKKLLDSGDKVIAETSPVDAIWGTGTAEDKALGGDGKEIWTGLNLLGKALMEVRRILREEEKEEEPEKKRKVEKEASESERKRQKD
jgi:ribA/ribD-fused uncharacterized protein